MKLRYPQRLSLAQTPTPLIPLNRLSSALGGPRIWMKRDDMTGSVVSGNKIRKLEFTLARAIAEQCDTIITAGGVQSNHCRTTAILCAQLGLHCHLILRGDADSEVDGNLLLDKLAGADISFYDNIEYTRRESDIFQGIADDYAARGHKAWSVPIGASDGTGLWGYIAACDELKVDFAREQINPKHIVVATGSGGTQGGLTVGAGLFDLNATVWGINVCDDEQYFLNKVRHDIDQWQQWYADYVDPAFRITADQVRVIDGYVGAGYAQASAEVFDTIKWLARLEGVVLDPVYTGKAFYGMIQELKQGRFSDSEDIVFVHTGGLFGLFAQKQLLQFD